MGTKSLFLEGLFRTRLGREVVLVDCEADDIASVVSVAAVGGTNASMELLISTNTV